MNLGISPNQRGNKWLPLPHIKSQNHEDDTGSQYAPRQVEQDYLSILPGVERTQRHPNRPHQGEHQNDGSDPGRERCRCKTRACLERRVLICSHNL